MSELRCECGGLMYRFDNVMLGCTDCDRKVHTFTHCHTLQTRALTAEGKLERIAEKVKTLRQIDVPAQKLAQAIYEIIKGEEIECDVCKGKRYYEFGGDRFPCPKCGHDDIPDEKPMAIELIDKEENEIRHAISQDKDFNGECYAFIMKCVTDIKRNAYEQGRREMWNIVKKYCDDDCRSACLGKCQYDTCPKLKEADK